MKYKSEQLELSIVLPCLNEAETIGICLKKAAKFLQENKINGELVVGDNDSSDGSQEIALSFGARVVDVKLRGYGAALDGAIRTARGKYIIMGDADNSYDFSNIMPFVEKLRDGYDLVMGNRFQGGISPGAMPPLHKYFGNPLLTAIGRFFFRSNCKDFHCGLRGFNRQSILALNLQTKGMEFASEMVVKATLAKLKTTEVPITLQPDGRSRPPHLRSWRDGWRHLRFLLMYSPRWLFLLPGVLLIVLGIALFFLLLLRPLSIGTVTLDNHTFLFASGFLIIGYQALIFAMLTKIFAITAGLLPEDPTLKKAFKYFTLEVGLLFGAALILIGLCLSIFSIYHWRLAGFGPIEASKSMRLVIPGVTCLVLGSQTILSSFFLSILGLRRK